MAADASHQQCLMKSFWDKMLCLMVKLPDGHGLAHIDTIVEAVWWSLPLETNVVNTVSVRANGVEISGYISVKGKGKGSDSA